MKPYNYEKAAKSYRKEVEQGHMQHYNSTYETTRVISEVISIVGWVIVGFAGLPLVGLFIGLSKEGSGSGFGGFFSVAMIYFCVCGIIGGLLLVVAGQFTRATVDNADSTAEMLAIMKSGYVKDMSGNSENPKT